ncbi:uncharacterized protein LOC117234718 isoform X2 [Bombus vosnesenskii]|uniref:Uncharacterized protein LOC117234718 isoform X2 n=1 Tax=Bombus vosnesenskii TaxID=207650 RepID=A0A6J3KGR2_9HYME|nr:uncharacterized protein LOC117234718 isoform X2 [Bombus vosnesenskii]
MNVVLNVVPFFLAARVAIDTPWKYGPEYTFHVQVNSTAIPEEGSYMSIRLNVASKLVCQPKGFRILSCRFRDSKADSYATESLDPGTPAVPVSQVSRQEAYEINQDQFEIRFTEQGLDSLVVNENIQPRELDMIRVIVGQLNVGVLGEYDQTVELMENFTQGECVTMFWVERNVIGHALHVNRGYVLETIFGVKDGQLVQIKKIRNLHMCTHKVPYFFGSAESIRQVSDVVSTVSSSESHIVITSTEFISGTTNVINTSKVSEGMVTTLYENISVRLESILPALNEPPEVKDPEPASMFIGRWLMESSMEDDLSLEV